MSNETASYNTLKERAFRPRDRVDRVENLCVPGMPDLNACCAGIDVWVEIKTVMKEPVRQSTALLGSSHRLSQEQMNWLMMHHRAGGRGFVYIDTPSRRYLIPGMDADRINSSTVSQLMLLADWSAPVPTPSVRWEELRAKLIA